MEILPPITITGGMSSASALLGTTASQDVVTSINQQIGNPYIQPQFDENDKMFYQQFVLPAKEAIHNAKGAAINAGLIDEFKDFNSLDDLYHVPACMIPAMLEYQPVRRLIQQGRIDGFGVPLSHIPKGDPTYHRLINNGTSDWIDNCPLSEDKKSYEVNYEWVYDSEDPDLTIEQIEQIAQMRRFIDKALQEDQDPTNMGSPIM